MQLWQESLELKDKIGNVKGKAATLANMAWAAGRQGDAARELELNLAAATALAEVRAWLDLITVLSNLGAGHDPNAVRYLAQAVWLLLRATAPVDASVSTTAVLLEKVGPAAEAGPLIAAAAIYFVATRGEQHPQRQKLQQLAMGRMAACAQARNVPEEELQQWLTTEGLLHPGKWLPKLDAALVQLGGGDEQWLFDRSRLHELATTDGGDTPS